MKVTIVFETETQDATTFKLLADLLGKVSPSEETVDAVADKTIGFALDDEED